MVLPIESNLKRLQEIFNDDSVMKKHTLQFAIRFDLLFYRCRHAFLREILHLSNYLVTLKDPSFQTKILAESLCRAVIKLGTENVHELALTIESCEEKKLPCVEVELRLLQLSIHCLVKRAGKMDCLRGKADDVEDAEIFDVVGEVNVQPNKDILAKAKVNDALDTEASLTRIFELSQRYPRSAGKYMRQASGTKASLKNGLKPGPIFTEEARIVERGWRECKVGGITKCGNGHPYPAVVFEECPECGHEKIPAQQPAQEPAQEPAKQPAKEPDYEAHLFEDKFLAWMRKI